MWGKREKERDKPEFYCSWPEAWSRWN